MNPAIRSSQTNMIPTMIRAVILYRRRIHPLQWAAAEVDRDQISAVYRGQKERWLDCKAIGSSVFRAIHAPAYAAGATAYLICDSGYSRETMLEFMRQLSTGELAAHSPLLSLRRIMSTYAVHREQHPDYEPLAYLIRGWNLYQAGAKVDILSWKPDDGMPRISSH